MDSTSMIYFERTMTEFSLKDSSELWEGYQLTMNGGKVFVRNNNTLIQYARTNVFRMSSGAYLEWSGSNVLVHDIAPLRDNQEKRYLSGGVFNASGSCTINITGSNLTFTRNVNTRTGGGVFALTSSQLLISGKDVYFHGNAVGQLDGTLTPLNYASGGVINASSNSVARISGKNISFVVNSASGLRGGGGAVHINTSSTLVLDGTDISFRDNFVTTAFQSQGGGAIAVQGSGSALNITGNNISFINNVASGMALWYAFEPVDLLEDGLGRTAMKLLLSAGGVQLDTDNFVRGSSSIKFSSTSSILTIPLDFLPMEVTAANGMTISFWFRMQPDETLSNANILYFYGCGDGFCSSFHIRRSAFSNNIEFYTGTRNRQGTYTTTTGTVADGMFHHIVWSIAHTYIHTNTGIMPALWNITLDNVLVCRECFIEHNIPSMIDANIYLRYTRQEMGGGFVGNIDDFRWFSRC